MRDNNAVEATSLWKIYRIQKNVSISLLGRDMECKKKKQQKKKTLSLLPDLLTIYHLKYC